MKASVFRLLKRWRAVHLWYEVVGDAAYLFDPYDEKQIRDAMEKVLGDSSLAQSLVERGYRRVELFTPERIVNTTKAVFDKIKG